MAPTFTVGALCVVERGDDDHIVLIRHRYRTNWGLPGGLLKKGEHPSDAARREVREEIGIAIELVDESTVVVDPDLRRVDVVFRGRPIDGSQALRCASAEIVSAEWHRLDQLPQLQPEAESALRSRGLVPALDR